MGYRDDEWIRDELKVTLLRDANELAREQRQSLAYVATELSDIAGELTGLRGEMASGFSRLNATLATIASSVANPLATQSNELLQRGLYGFNNGLWEEAEADFVEAASLNHYDPFAPFYAGLCMIRRGQSRWGLAAALFAQAFRLACGIDQRFAATAALLGARAFNADGSLDRAQELLVDAANRLPPCPDVQLALGLVSRDQERIAWSFGTSPTLIASTPGLETIISEPAIDVATNRLLPELRQCARSVEGVRSTFPTVHNQFPAVQVLPVVSDLAGAVQTVDLHASWRVLLYDVLEASKTGLDRLLSSSRAPMPDPPKTQGMLGLRLSAHAQLRATRQRQEALTERAIAEGSRRREMKEQYLPLLHAVESSQAAMRDPNMLRPYGGDLRIDQMSERPPP